jgi:hypothetical protein
MTIGSKTICDRPNRTILGITPEKIRPFQTCLTAEDVQLAERATGMVCLVDPSANVASLPETRISLGSWAHEWLVCSCGGRNKATS